MDKQLFINTLRNYLHNRNAKNHCMVGDFNINILENDSLAVDFVTNWFEMGYIPLFNSITRPNPVNPREGTCIDMFLKSNCTNFTSGKYMSIFTDHYPLLTTINLETKKTNIQQKNVMNTYLETNKLQEEFINEN